MVGGDVGIAPWDLSAFVNIFRNFLFTEATTV